MQGGGFKAWRGRGAINTVELWEAGAVRQLRRTREAKGSVKVVGWGGGWKCHVMVGRCPAPLYCPGSGRDSERRAFHMQAMVAGQETGRRRGEARFLAGIHVTVPRAEPWDAGGRPAETDCVAGSGGT